MGLFSTPKVEIWKEDDYAQECLEELQELHDRAKGYLKKEIQAEIKIQEAGIKGEENVLYELKCSGMDLIVLQDLHIECGELSTQIDFFIVTPQVNFILECKNLMGDIEINHRGEFIRTYRFNGKDRREGIESPVAQNERHMRILKMKKMEHAGLFQRFALNTRFYDVHKSLVVLAHPKTVLYADDADDEVMKQVIRLDQLISVIQKMCQDSKEPTLSRREMRKIAERILSYHTEDRCDYIKRYRDKVEAQEQKEILASQMETEMGAVGSMDDDEETADAINENVVSQEDFQTEWSDTGVLMEPNREKTQEILFCPRCGSPLVERDGKYGPFWGCSGFPRCRFTKNIAADDCGKGQ